MPYCAMRRRRTQLYLDEDQYRWLKRQAGARGTIASVVRRLIDEARDRGGRWEDDPLHPLPLLRPARPEREAVQRSDPGSGDLPAVRRGFVDTSAFVALRDGDDRNHTAARRADVGLVSTRTSPFTSNYVFAETYTALLVWAGREAAVRWWRAFRASAAVEAVRVDGEVEEAWAILGSHPDERWSYVDATSFAVMAREGCDEALTFDRNFAQCGLRVVTSAV